MTDRLDRLEAHITKSVAGFLTELRSTKKPTTGTDAMSTLNYDPAYPMIEGTDPGQRFGLTKREMFAAMAMQGLLSQGMAPSDHTIDGRADFLRRVSMRSVSVADALIAELNKREDNVHA